MSEEFVWPEVDPEEHRARLERLEREGRLFAQQYLCHPPLAERYEEIPRAAWFRRSLRPVLDEIEVWT